MNFANRGVESQRLMNPFRNFSNDPTDRISRQAKFIQRLRKDVAVGANNHVFNDLIGCAQVDYMLRFVETFKLDRTEPGIESLLI
jgi:hypothetical protein